MPFAPHEIENKRFVNAFRGYQPDEVESFLRTVAADYRDALERAEASAGAAPLREAAALLASAEAEAAAIRERAERDAAAIRDAARLEAELCLAEVDCRLDELQRFERELALRRLYGLADDSRTRSTKALAATP